MFIPEIDWTQCQVCDPCKAKLVCNLRAIVIIDTGDVPYIEFARCSGCGNCIPACPFKAINIRTSK